jgi:hypothetical protein
VHRARSAVLLNLPRGPVHMYYRPTTHLPWCVLVTWGNWTWGLPRHGWALTAHHFYPMSELWGASPKKHFYVRYMSMFVIIDTCPSKQYDCLNYATARLVRLSDTYTAHQQTTTCFKIVFFSNFFWNFFTEFQNEGGRKPPQPPRRRRAGLILLYITSVAYAPLAPLVIWW